MAAAQAVHLQLSNLPRSVVWNNLSMLTGSVRRWLSGVLCLDITRSNTAPPPTTSVRPEIRRFQTPPLPLLDTGIYVPLLELSRIEVA